MFNKLKKALGFGPGDENDELITDDPEVPQDNVSALTFNPQAVASDAGTADTEATVKEIFEHVVEHFNKTLPDFLKNSVDPEKEKKYLYETLSADVKAHLAALESNVHARVGESWRAEREKLQTELKTLSKTAKDIEAKRNELKTAQLSSERQRRAMTERIHELEKQMLALEAEKEQVDLENKSMLNKVKVAGVYEKDNEALREQIAALQAELNNRKVGNAGAGDEETVFTAPEPQIIDPNPELQEKIEALNAENAELKENIEKLREIEAEHKEMVGKMDEIDKNLSKINEAHNSKEIKIKGLKKELYEANRNLEDMKKELDAARKEIDETHKKLEAANKEIAETEELKKAKPEKSNYKEKTENPITFREDDDILNDTDWIVQPKSETKNNRNRDKSKTKKNSDFDDGQMSLW